MIVMRNTVFSFFLFVAFGMALPARAEESPDTPPVRGRLVFYFENDLFYMWLLP